MRKLHLLRSLMTVVLLVVAVDNVYAEKINKWVDDQGQVHYGDKPPPDAKLDSVRIIEQSTIAIPYQLKNEENEDVKRFKCKSAKIESSIIEKLHPDSYLRRGDYRRASDEISKYCTSAEKYE